uniref:BHLH domain-containing protein n=1 Tax=Meloidogyne incognita TaxID=6306 RepID=A0A914MTK2_MELIC
MLTQQNNNKNQQINHPQIPDFNVFFGNRRGLNACSGANRRSPTPDCPSFEHLERKQKKPIMERKRRARLNACFERLKEILLSSDTQQSSKLEKADVLEKTVIFVRHLQKEHSLLRQHLNQLLAGTESGQQFQKGISIAIAATNELLAGLQPELCKRVQVEVPERILRALGVSSSNNSNLFTSNNLISTSTQQQNNNKLINPSLISNVNQQKYTNNYFINPINNNNISNKNNIFPNNIPPIPPATCYRLPSTSLNLFPLQQQNSFLNYYYPSNYVINNLNNGIKKVAPSKEPNKEENEEEEEQVVDVESLINEEEEQKEEFNKNEENKEVNSDSLKMRRKNISRKTVWRPY